MLFPVPHYQNQSKDPRKKIGTFTLRKFNNTSLDGSTISLIECTVISDSSDNFFNLKDDYYSKNLITVEYFIF